MYVFVRQTDWGGFVFRFWFYVHVLSSGSRLKFCVYVCVVSVITLTSASGTDNRSDQFEEVIDRCAYWLLELRRSFHLFTILQSSAQVCWGDDDASWQGFIDSLKCFLLSPGWLPLLLLLLLSQNLEIVTWGTVWDLPSVWTGEFSFKSTEKTFKATEQPFKSILFVFQWWDRRKSTTSCHQCSWPEHRYTRTHSFSLLMSSTADLISAGIWSDALRLNCFWFQCLV